MLPEQTIRLSMFIGVFIIIALVELMFPRRPLRDSKSRRWFTNISLAVIDSIVARTLFPVLPIGMAQIAQTRNWGILNQCDTPLWFRFVISLLILDLVIYFQHILFHRSHFLWRFHRMHHTDLDLDVSSGNRFHPVEIALSTLVKIVVIALLGAPAISVLVFEVSLNACALFNHANLNLPPILDRAIGIFLVTPDMHRVHHSIIPRETNSNYGFSVPWWDRLFKTYRQAPEMGHLEMTIGLKEYTAPSDLTLIRLLIQPFK